MSESKEWGTRLSQPDMRPAIAPIAAAFSATRLWQTPNVPACVRNQLNTVRRRVNANFLPPAGYFFEYPITPDTVATLVTLQQQPGERAKLHRDPIELSKWAGQRVLGDRLYFPFDLPEPGEPNVAKLSLVDAAGNRSRFGVSIPVGRLGVEHVGFWPIAPGEQQMPDGFVDPADITAEGMEQYGLAVAAAKTIISNEPPEPRSRSSA